MGKMKFRKVLKQLPIMNRIYAALSVLKNSRTIRENLIKQNIREEIFGNLRDMLADDPILKIPQFKGVFAIDPRSDALKRIVVEKQYEPCLVQRCIGLIDRNRDMMDIGANIGFYSVLFAKELSSGKVLSVEPVANALVRLRRNISLNNVVERVIVFDGAASDRVGEMQIKTVEGKEEYSSLGEMVHPGVVDEKFRIQTTKTSTIDDLVDTYSLDPGFIKIDVEGAEHLVLRGAQKVLQKQRPIILSELSNYMLLRNGSSAKDVMKFIRNYNYEIIDPVDPQAVPGEKDFGDILCIPR